LPHIVSFFPPPLSPNLAKRSPCSTKAASFERRDYAAALKRSAAVTARMEGPAVQYNIGVAAYRLPALRQSARCVRAGRPHADDGGACDYNLGLVAKAQGDERAAIDAFAAVYSQTDDERLRSLARAQLDSVAEAAPSRELTWVAFAASGIGYDDNVTLTSNGQALGIAREEDVYADTLLVGSVLLASSWRIDADASFLNYADLNEFDQWGLGTGGRYRFALDAWTLDVGAQLNTTYLDGERFDVRQAVYVQAMRPLSTALALRARYRLSNVDGSDRYPGLDGLRHEVTARLVQTGCRGWRASLSVRSHRLRLRHALGCATSAAGGCA
jgi:hypothetical protein